MDDELDTFCRRDADLEHPPGLIGADQHDQVVDVEDPDRVALGVEHVVVGDPVFAGACQDHGIHAINLA